MNGEDKARAAASGRSGAREPGMGSALIAVLVMILSTSILSLLIYIVMVTIVPSEPRQVEEGGRRSSSRSITRKVRGASRTDLHARARSRSQRNLVPFTSFHCCRARAPLRVRLQQYRQYRRGRDRGYRGRRARRRGDEQSGRRRRHRSRRAGRRARGCAVRPAAGTSRRAGPHCGRRRSAESRRGRAVADARASHRSRKPSRAASP